MDVESTGDCILRAFTHGWGLWHRTSWVKPFTDLYANHLPTRKESLHHGYVQLEELVPRLAAMTEFNLRNHNATTL